MGKDDGVWPMAAVVADPAAPTDVAGRAEALAARLDVPLAAEARDGRVLSLRCDADGVALVGGGLELRADFADMLPRLAPGNLSRELLVRAARLKGLPAGYAPRAVDATAGLGADSLLLAASGFEVELFESDPVIAALLEDALRRAREHPKLVDIVSRMHLHPCDSIAALPHLPVSPDVVYLDPMFPERRKSAAVKKKFQLLHRLERPCGNQEELLHAALAAHPRKVVVKRPVKGPDLAGVKPSHTVAGKAVRYDCIVPPRP